jgi:hypothetical protein
MRAIVFGKANENVNKVLPHLVSASFSPGGAITGIPNEVQHLGVCEGILSRAQGRLECGPRVVLVKDELRTLRSEAAKYVAILSRNMATLQREFRGSSPARNGFGWEELRHTLTYALCLDLGVLCGLYERGALAEERGFCVWLFPGEDAQKQPFGVRTWAYEPRSITVNQLWHAELRNPVLTLGHEHLRALSRLSTGAPTSSIDARARLLLRMRGLLGRFREAPEGLMVPVFDNTEDAALFWSINDIAREIVEEVTLPVLAEKVRDPRFAHGTVRLLMEYAGYLVVQQGLLPPIESAGGVAKTVWIAVNVPGDSFLFAYN